MTDSSRSTSAADVCPRAPQRPQQGRGLGALGMRVLRSLSPRGPILSWKASPAIAAPPKEADPPIGAVCLTARSSSSTPVQSLTEAVNRPPVAPARDSWRRPSPRRHSLTPRSSQTPRVEPSVSDPGFASESSPFFAPPSTLPLAAPGTFIGSRAECENSTLGMCTSRSAHSLASSSNSRTQRLCHTARDLNRSDGRWMMQAGDTSSAHCNSARCPSRGQSSEQLGHSSRPVSASRSEEASEDTAVQDHCLKLLDAVFDFPMAEGASKFMLEANPEIAWLGHCLVRCPLPPCWSALESRYGGETCRYVDMSTGTVSDAAPLMKQFVDLARVMLFCRSNPHQADFIAGRLKFKYREYILNAENARKSWNGPHMDANTGAEYWHCPVTGQSTWGDPGGADDYLARVVDKLSSALPHDSCRKAKQTIVNAAPQWSTLPEWVQASSSPMSGSLNTKDCTLADVGMSICQDRMSNKTPKNGRKRSASMGTLPGDDAKQTWWSSAMSDPFEVGGTQHDVSLRPESRRRRPQSCERLEPICQPQKSSSSSSKVRCNSKNSDDDRQQLKRDEVTEGYSYIGKYASEAPKPATEIMKTFKAFEAEMQLKKLPPPPPPPPSARRSSTVAEQQSVNLVEPSPDTRTLKNVEPSPDTRTLKNVPGDIPLTPAMSQGEPDLGFTSKFQDETPPPQDSSTSSSEALSVEPTRIPEVLEEIAEPLHQCIAHNEESQKCKQHSEEATTQDSNSDTIERETEVQVDKCDLGGNESCHHGCTEAPELPIVKDDIAPKATDSVVQELDAVFAASSSRSVTSPRKDVATYHQPNECTVDLLTTCAKAPCETRLVVPLEPLPPTSEARNPEVTSSNEAVPLESMPSTAEARNPEVTSSNEEVQLCSEEIQDSEKDTPLVHIGGIEEEAQELKHLASDETLAEVETKSAIKAELVEEVQIATNLVDGTCRTETRVPQVLVENVVDTPQLVENVVDTPQAQTVQYFELGEGDSEAISTEIEANNYGLMTREGFNVTEESTIHPQASEDLSHVHVKSEIERKLQEANESTSLPAMVEAAFCEGRSVEAREDVLPRHNASFSASQAEDVCLQAQVDESHSPNSNRSPKVSDGMRSTHSAPHWLDEEDKNVDSEKNAKAWNSSTTSTIEDCMNTSKVGSSERMPVEIFNTEVQDEESNDDKVNAEPKIAKCDKPHVDECVPLNVSLSFADLSLLEREIANESALDIAVDTKACVSIGDKAEPVLADVSILDVECVQANKHIRAPLDFAITSKGTTHIPFDTRKATWGSSTEKSDEERWCVQATQQALSDTDTDTDTEDSGLKTELGVNTHDVEKPQTELTSRTPVLVVPANQQRVRESALTWVEEVAYGKANRHMDVIEDLIWGPAPEFESSPRNLSNRSEGTDAEQRKLTSEGRESKIESTAITSSPMPIRPKRPPRNRSMSRDLPCLPGSSIDEELVLTSAEDIQAIEMSRNAPALKTSRPRGCTRVVGHRLAPAGGA